MAALLRFIVILLLLGRSVHADARSNYYVDAIKGNDLYDGSGQDRAFKTLEKLNSISFQPGDSVLFHAAHTWHGQLVIKNSGKQGLPVVISRYGGAGRPVITGDGLVDQTVLIDGADQIEIHHLEITNHSSSEGNRTGVLIKALEGYKKHYVLNDLYIHDISGTYSFEMKGKNTGGIGIIGGRDTRFDDILIENCDIGPVTRVGIFTNLTDSRNAVQGKRPVTNLVIRRNKIHHCSGDGVIVRYAYRPLIEYNLVYENHNAPEHLVKHGVALWCRSTDEAVFQYNEVYATRGSMDGQAFDTDLDTYRTLVQYNYSHHNEGGFMLVYGTSSDAIVRYNISAGDGAKGKHIFDFPVWVKPRGSGTFHNNTIFITKDAEAVIADEATGTARFYNNIFYNKGSGLLTIPSEEKEAFFYNNAYTGYRHEEITDHRPLFTDPGFDSLFAVPGGYNQAAKLKLPERSKLLKKGITRKQMPPAYWLPDCGKHDFGGRKLNRRYQNIGAY